MDSSDEEDLEETMQYKIPENKLKVENLDIRDEFDISSNSDDIFNERSASDNNKKNNEYNNIKPKQSSIKKQKKDLKQTLDCEYGDNSDQINEFHGKIEDIIDMEDRLLDIHCSILKREADLIIEENEI